MTNWRKSTRCSTTSCVEINYVKPGKCDTGGNCVEVGATPEAVYVRDSKPGNDGTVLGFAPQAWRAFLVGIDSLRGDR